MARNGVLIVATGGPTAPDDVVSYMTALAGSAPEEGAVTALRRALLAIGGRSPLHMRAERIAAALERALNALDPAPPLDDQGESLLPLSVMTAGRAEEPIEVPVQVGFAWTEPSITDALARLAATGVERVVIVPLTPFASPDSAASLRAVAIDAATAAGLEISEAADYGAYDSFERMLADLSQAAVEEVFPEHRPLIVFVAPAAVSASQDDRSAAERAVERLAGEIGLGEVGRDELEAAIGVNAFGGPGRAAPWVLAYASAPGMPGPVPGLSVLEAVEAARAAGLGGVAVLPFAWTVDDTVTLYDLDVLAADAALSADMEYARAAVPNDDQRLIEAMAEAVRVVLRQP